MSVAINTAKTNSKPKLSLSSVTITIKSILIITFYVLFCYTFTIAVGGVLFSNNMYEYSPAIPLLMASAEFALLIFSFYMIKKHAETIKKLYPWIVSIGLLLLFAVNVKLGYMLQFEPIFDLGAIFTGAKEWATTGNFINFMEPSVDENYFYFFPNNLGGMTFLFVVFKAALIFKVTDYFAVAMIANAILATTTVLVTILICKRLFGITQSVMALMFILLSPPFYTIAPVFYTDSLSMVFPVLIMYWYLRFNDSKTSKQRFLFAVLIGLSCVIGMLIKFTVLIALIAVLIHAILTKGIVPFLRIVVASGACIAAGLLAFNMYFYTVHLDTMKADALNIPYSHWFMMSLDSGYYSHDDYKFTISFDDKYERNSAINAKIKERIKERGFFGIFGLLYWKDIVTFGDSTYGQSDFLDDAPVNDTKLHKWVLYDGRYYNRYKYICTATYFTMQLLMLLSAVSVLLKKKKDFRNMVPLLCLFGVMLFFAFWEVDGRYVTNFVPMIVIAAVSGLDVVMGVLSGKRTRIKNLLVEWRTAND